MSKTDTITRETKTLSFQVKAIGISTNDQGQEIGRIEAYGAVFNNIDDGNDKILKGSFIRTINNSKSRAEARKSPYMLKMLWQHKTDEVIGSWSDVSEDNFGLKCTGDVLLATQRGREYYELAKAGMLDEFSIIYDVMPGGSTYDKSGVRELSELRLFSIDPVTFPMNDETYLVGVKAASGKTSWSLADKDTKWSGAQAKKDIQEWATSGDEINWSKAAQCFFWVSKSPPEKLADCKMPFVAKVDGKMQAIPQGIISCAGVIQGAMGGADIDDVAGVKAKIATYYKKMDMTPPWEDDGKSSRRHMDRKDKEKKTVQEHYAEEMCKDLLEDWQDVFVCTLTEAILDAFKIGDQPEQDVSQALDDFKELVLTKFVPEAIECDLSGYISDNSNTYSSVDSVMQYGSDSKPNYSYYSNDSKREQKIGKPISADNQKTIDAHVKDLKAKAKSMKAAMQAHTDAMHDTADSLGDVAGNNAKAGRSISTATAKAINDAASAMHDHADKSMDTVKDHVKAVRTAADDFATRMQGAETPYAGDDPGTPDPGQQEGKGNDQVIPSQKTHDTQERTSEEDTVDEKDLELALMVIQGIKTAV